MDVSVTPLVERIARVLAGQRISANGVGQEESAAKLIDLKWPDYRDDALAVLRTSREPTIAMDAAGDVAVWERMVLVALDEAKPDMG